MGSSEWTSADLLFLADTLRHGMPVDRVAGFLSRSESEVRVKARELNVSIADDAREERRTEIGLRPRPQRLRVMRRVRSSARVDHLSRRAR
jgi:hypothetical protein